MTIFRCVAVFSIALFMTFSVHLARADETSALPMIENQAARVATFQARDTPANLDKLGRELLAHTYIPVWPLQEFNRPGGWEALKEVRARIDRNEYASALERFKIYTLDKLRDIDNQGLPRGRFDPFSSGVNGVQWIRPLLNVNQKDEILQQAQEILQGILTVNGKKINIGPAGAVNWQAASAGANRGATGWPWDLEPFYPLLSAYIFTGEVRYMESWAAYADDWAMNQHDGPGATNIADMPDQWANGVETMLTLLRYLGGVANLPQGAQSLPTGTFARVFTRVLDDFVPVSILYHRSNPQNWNDASLTALPDVGYFLDEYLIGRQLLQESRRRLDLLISTHHLPDGTEMDTTVGYSNLFIIGPGTFMERINTRQLRVPDWMLARWERDEWRNAPDLHLWEQTIHAEMLKRARSLAGHTLASGEWPIGGTRNGRRNDSQNLYNVLHYFLPDAFQNPDIANIMAISTGRRAAGVPSFTSERFPYGGHAYIRAGWDAKDPYLYFYAAPYPLSGSLSVRNNNALGLSAFGYDLLETGENGVYDQPHSPVKVDGLEQDFQFGIPTWGHRGPLLTTSVYDAPPDWRWHASDQFNVIEGVYAGNFGKEKKLDDVRHQRIVQYVRSAGVWIVTDRLSSPNAHNYTLDWRFGIKPGDERDFTAEQIKVDAPQSAIKTARDEGANVSLYHFPSTPLAFTTGEERTPPQGYRLHDFLRVSGDWKSQGQSNVVTVIYPRENMNPDLSDLKPLNAKNVTGFQARTPEGEQIRFQAAIATPEVLQMGDVRARAETLLLVVGADGTRRGVALGCQALFVGGKKMEIAEANFEFQIQGAKLVTTPIYTPLQPVKIAPNNTTAFMGNQEVTLACSTPRAEIRYTLDGSDPTSASPLYRGPITLTASTVVKARSLRPGTQTLPTTMSGTLASVVTSASFVAATPMKATPAADAVAGLHFDLYQARWHDLLSGLNRLTPVKSGDVNKLFDMSAKGAASTFAFQYSGFWEAPADGVYNFVAPPESYQPNIMAGYELRLMLDGREWYPSTSRHALGVWSVALEKGRHSFALFFADLRADGTKLNQPGKTWVWNGSAPKIQISGPNLPLSDLAEQRFWRAK